MFNLFRSLSRLAHAADSFAGSLEEADHLFRANVLNDTSQKMLEAPPDDADGTGEAKGGKNGRKATATR